jgi:hypothetical protein
MSLKLTLDMNTPRGASVALLPPRSMILSSYPQSVKVNLERFLVMKNPAIMTVYCRIAAARFIAGKTFSQNDLDRVRAPCY